MFSSFLGVSDGLYHQTFNNPFHELYTERNLKRSDGKGYLLYKSTEWHEMEELLENTSA